MQKEEGKMLVDEQVMPGVLAEEKPAEQGVPVPMEETLEICAFMDAALRSAEKQGCEVRLDLDQRTG